MSAIAQCETFFYICLFVCIIILFTTLVLVKSKNFYQKSLTPLSVIHIAKSFKFLLHHCLPFTLDFANL